MFPGACLRRMKRYHLPVLIIFATALAIAGCRDPVAPQTAENPIAPQTAEDKQKTPATWEYKVQKIYLTAGNQEGLRVSLNKEGDEGWELVSATPLDPIENNYSASPLALAIFKRAKR